MLELFDKLLTLVGITGALAVVYGIVRLLGGNPTKKEVELRHERNKEEERSAQQLKHVIESYKKSEEAHNEAVKSLEEYRKEYPNSSLNNTDSNK